MTETPRAAADHWTVQSMTLSEPPIEPPGEDLRVVPLQGEHPADYIARVRETPPDSQSPSDIVPNVAWINPPPEAT